ncbi:hypothetical protein DEO72_LG10g2324 [Vigna unguiculata]|uniref:Uncharacterized protein n=1 Tax=Vigna unguiculata TaxID=3917 RepID=A0A4D6NDY3_VIGUN|nr:hypothetical protein DEO72_LG10g2324 [Vigna unguiculata]
MLGFSPNLGQASSKLSSSSRKVYSWSCRSRWFKSRSPILAPFQKQYSHTLIFPREAMLGFSPNLGQASSKLSSSSRKVYSWSCRSRWFKSRSPILAPFQVREARVMSFSLFLACWKLLDVCIVWKQWRDLLFSAKRDRLAQARLTRTDQGDTHELPLRRSALVLSEALSRSGERRSPKREGVKALGCRCS